MTQTPMTTREAIKHACTEIAMLEDYYFKQDSHNCRACAALCEAYNFKLSDFFDNLPVAE